MQSSNDLETHRVRFRFKNLGPIEEAELELGDLTVISGRNNTGKTYVAYALYGYFKTWRDLLLSMDDTLIESALKSASMTLNDLTERVLAEGQVTWRVNRETLGQERARAIRKLTREFTKKNLASVFDSSQETFDRAVVEAEFGSDFPENRSFRVNFGAGRVLSLEYNGFQIVLSYSYGQSDSEPLVEHLRLSGWIPSFYLFFLVRSIPEFNYMPFIQSAERFGISLFYKELDSNKNRLVDLLQKMGDDKSRESLSPFDLIEGTTSRYSLPIKDNIEFTRDLSNIQKERSEIVASKPFDDIKDMMEGYYRSTDDEVRFISKARKARSFNIPLHRTSSSVRGLSDLYFFLRHVCKKDQLLIIDEPESHLDTANQIQLARLLARLVRAGVKVLITTHSDYIIKEINNLIMLSRSFDSKSELVKKLKYKKEDFLPPESIRAYVAERNSLTPCTIDQFGIDMPVFDKTINDINRVSNELASRLMIEGDD